MWRGSSRSQGAARRESSNPSPPPRPVARARARRQRRRTVAGGGAWKWKPYITTRAVVWRRRPKGTGKAAGGHGGLREGASRKTNDARKRADGALRANISPISPAFAVANAAHIGPWACSTCTFEHNYECCLDTGISCCLCKYETDRGIIRTRRPIGCTCESRTDYRV